MRRARHRIPFVDLLQSEAMNKLHARKEDARARLLDAYVKGDQPAIDAAMATMREWCKARGFKNTRRRKGRGV